MTFSLGVDLGTSHTVAMLRRPDGRTRPLLFAVQLPGRPALSGEHLGDEVVPLGALSGVRSATCGCDTAVLACAADKDFVLVTFAD